jgi:hypothetical protein
VHFYNETTGNGGIIKTAGFGITNMTMRDMPADLAMHKSMNSMKWKVFEDIKSRGYKSGDDVKPEDANILIGIDGRKIDYGNFYFYNKNDGKYYTRKIIEYEGDYKYKVEQH